jgi:D-amino-acid dehydrogenase
MQELLVHEPALRFEHANAGKLVVYRTGAAFDAARRLLDYQRSLGCEQEALDVKACIAQEPALAHLGTQLQGGIFTRSEDSGDCYQFCVSMMRLLLERGVGFRFGTTITQLRRDSAQKVAAYAGDERLDADHIVLSTAAASVPLLRTLDIRVPLYPLKGYSLTAPVVADAAAPRVSITDFERKIVYARLGNRLRIAGMADITGRRADIDPKRVATLRAQSAATFPGAVDFDSAAVWCGLRPATPKSMPIIDGTPFANLWLNLGQGALGFTLALASGRLLGDLVGRREPAVTLDGFGLRNM